MSSHVKYPLNWDLDRLLPHPDTEAFRARLDEYGSRLAGLASRTDSIPAARADADVVAEWASVLAEYQLIEAWAEDLDSFVGCHLAADAGNAGFRVLEGELSAREPLRERIATNIELALHASDEHEFERFVAMDERLNAVSYFLRVRRRHARFRLPKAEESLAAELSVDGLRGWTRLYSQLSGDLRLQVMERGELVSKSPGQVPFDAPLRGVRENNFFAARKAWDTIASPCAAALNRISGARLTIYRRLGLRDHLEVPLHDNRIRRETLAAMWSAIDERKPILLKYLAKKAARFGLARLCWYDLQAPLVAGGGRSRAGTVDYQSACDEIIAAFDGFTSDLGAFARRALTGKWIEAENRPGKRQGGFCTTFPTGQESRIFMTFTDSPDSVSTLAHELGHAYHSDVLMGEALFHRRYPMNLAETASTFAETVLSERERRSTRFAEDELAILDRMLMDAVAFLMNIQARFLFEDAFHVERARGELSAARLDELMLDAQKRAYLDALADDGWYPRFWVSKQHFYFSDVPFYNFPYTFGYLLSLGLYALADESGGPFGEQFRAFLIATGCRDAEDAVQHAFGQDLTTRSFWNKSLDIVEQRVERFLQLAE